MQKQLHKCQQCRKRVFADQIVRFIWKKQNLKLDLCPTCYQVVFQKHLKETPLGLDAMIRSGYYRQGAREMDFKSYLEKWAKKVKDQI